jgi:hypothetical protein
MKSSALLGEWLRSIAALSIVTGRTPSDTAGENASVFSVEEAQAAGTTVSELADFIGRAFRAYALQAALAGLSGWFYAWYDETSGTLRCSVCDVGNPSDLPFSCALEIHDDPMTIAEAALASPYASRIPQSELKEVEWTDIEDATAKFVLAVYVRGLVKST